MARAFTEPERDALRSRLRQAARESIPRHGLRGTRVEALARRAGISKGAFYLLYPTKDALVLDVLAEVEREERAELERRLAEPWHTPRELVARFLAHHFELLERHPVLHVLTDPGEAVALFRALPPEELAARAADDDRFYRGILEAWRARGWIGAFDPALLARLPRLAMGLAQQREQIGEDRFGALVELLIDALAGHLAATPRTG